MSNINYNEKGQRSDIHYGNGCKTRYEYDKNTFRLIRLLTTRNTGRDILQDILYTYDPVGNIVEIVDNAQQNHYFSNSVIEPRAMYKYDALYRLIEATGRELSSLQLPTHSDFANNIPVPNMGNNAMQNYTQQFTYDELGNILQMKAVNNWTRNYVYDGATNRLLKHDNDQTLPDYTYDEHGNITKMPHLQSMHYDYKDQLNKVVLDASENTAYYIYDANGQRVRKVVVKGNVREERIYVGGYERYIKIENGSQTIERISVSIAEVAEEPREEEDNSRAVYQIDLNKRIALIEYIEGQSPTIRYQLGNHLGSASLELNATGQIISYEEFHPFGTTSYRSGTNDTEVSLKRYKYIGKERDEETGLYCYGARYYAAWIGRFVSVDPLKEERQWVSPYNYCQNNPINRTDRTGALDKMPDWFQNEVTGDIHYNSEWKKGDESQLGENWVWMGENGMFSETKEEIQKGIEKGVFKNADWAYNYPNKGIDGDITYGQILDFSGKNAENFMSALGYKKAPIQAVQYKFEMESYLPAPMGTSITMKSENIIQINEKYSYIKNEMYEANTYSISNAIHETLSPFASHRVSRVGFSYKQSTLYKHSNFVFKIANGLTGSHSSTLTRVVPNWDSYHGEDEMIIKFLKLYPK